MRSRRRGLRARGVAGALALVIVGGGCAGPFGPAAEAREPACREPARAATPAAPEPLEVFRRAETQRAEQLAREIDRLKADLRQAEAALVEVESGLARSHSRAEAVSALAEARIEIERAAAAAPWRADEIARSRVKLAEAERQIEEERFGAALFFVYRVRRLADAVLEEIEQVADRGNARAVHARRVNLRAGPSTAEPILAVLEAGTPVFVEADSGDWVLVQVSGGPAGWIHRRLLGEAAEAFDALPAAPAAPR